MSDNLWKETYWGGDYSAVGIVDEISNELMAAVAKHGYNQTPMSARMTDEERLVILVEEIGEVARAMTYDEGSRAALRRELIQVAAMSVAWLIGMEP